MNGDLILNILCVIAGGMSATSVLNVLKRIIKKRQEQKEKIDDLVMLRKRLNEQQLELLKIKNEIQLKEINNKDDKDKYKILEKQIDNLLQQYKKNA